MSETPAQAAQSVEDEATTSRLEKAASVAATLLRHKELVVAALELLRDQNVLNEHQQVQILAAYEEGSPASRSALHSLLTSLQQARLGKVLIDLVQEVDRAPPSPQTIRDVAQPYLAAAKEAFSEEARPYVERAKQRLLELKTLEEPALRRLEAVSENIKSAGKEVATGLKGMGREAADEIIRRGKRAWMSAETEELEREFFDWTLRNLPKAEQALVRVMLGFGLLLLFSGVLVAAREFRVLEEVALFVSIFLLLFLGLAFLNWGIKLSETLKSHRGDVQKLAQMTPPERRLFLTQKWAQRAQAEGLITSTEAQTVIEESINAMPASEPAPRPPA